MGRKKRMFERRRWASRKRWKGERGEWTSEKEEDWGRGRWETFTAWPLKSIGGREDWRGWGEKVRKGRERSNPWCGPLGKRGEGWRGWWHLNGDVLYAEPPRQYDSSNWKASCLPRGGGPKDKSWVKGKSIRSLPCRLSSRSFFFPSSLFPPSLLFPFISLSLSRRSESSAYGFLPNKKRFLTTHPFPSIST